MRIEYVPEVYYIVPSGEYYVLRLQEESQFSIISLQHCVNLIRICNISSINYIKI